MIIYINPLLPSIDGCKAFFSYFDVVKINYFGGIHKELER